MMDITSISDDFEMFDTQTSRAKNLLNVQLGSLEYAPDIGIDLEYFLGEDFRIQNESFKAYLIQVLANFGINVSTVTEVVEDLYTQYTFNLTPSESSTGLVAR